MIQSVDAKKVTRLLLFVPVKFILTLIERREKEGGE